MATDNEQLVLSISADVRQIQRQLKGLVGQTQRDTKAIEQAFGGIDKAASGAFAGVAANSNNAFRAGTNSARQFERASVGAYSGRPLFLFPAMAEIHGAPKKLCTCGGRGSGRSRLSRLSTRPP